MSNETAFIVFNPNGIPCVVDRCEECAKALAGLGYQCEWSALEAEGYTCKPVWIYRSQQPPLSTEVREMLEGTTVLLNDTSKGQIHPRIIYTEAANRLRALLNSETEEGE